MLILYRFVVYSNGSVKYVTSKDIDNVKMTIFENC